MITLLVKIAVAATTDCPEPRSSGLVPICDPSGTNDDLCVPDCNMDQLLFMGEKIVNTLIEIAFVITALFLVIGAFKMIISQGAPERISSAKSNITSAIIGLVIVLVSWAVLNTVLDAFVDKDRCENKWYLFQGLKCTAPEDTTASPPVPTPQE